jgi:hypothetical protein
MGFSPFGVDGPDFGSPQFLRAYSLLQQLSPLILKHQTDGSIDAVLLDDNDRSKTVQLGNYSLNIELERNWMNDQPMTDLGAGYAIIIAEPNDTYTIAGRAVQITFATKPGAPVQTVGLDSVEDGSFINGKWTPSRRLNGDEITLTRQFSEQAAIHQDTTGVRLEPDGPNIIRASVFPIK